jgi:transposase InsO family protein
MVNNRDNDMGFRLRKIIFGEWRRRRLSWQEIKAKYGFSKAWFYKFRSRFVRYGEEGLRDKKREAPILPVYTSWDERLKILDYIYDDPTHGPKRIAMNLPFKISANAVWEYLIKENLNTRRKRRLWAESQGKPTLTEKEKLLITAKDRHVESHLPGELVSLDTFTVSVAGLGKIWQYTACDTYSSYGWAKLYRDKTADNSVDFVFNHMVKNCPEGKIKRMLTDRGVEFYCARHEGVDGHFTIALNWGDIKHTVTKAQHPWTNGYAERLNQTIWQEFYLCRLTHVFGSIEELQKELDVFMTEYNFERMHTGYKLKAGGFKFPGHAFYDIRERDKMIEVKC